MTKKILSLILALAVLGGALAAEPFAISGYDKNGGYIYVTLGMFPLSSADSHEPILWRALTVENGAAYLLSEYILDSRPVQSDKENYRGWEGSELYLWLNGEFLETAFTASERAVIRQNTADKAYVTLLTADEVRTESYGFPDNSDHRAEGTVYARSRGLDSYSGRVRYSPWWLRDTSAQQEMQQRRIIEDGKLGRTGVHSRTTGVRPALWVDLALVVVAAGSGDKDDPFVLSPALGVATASETADIPAAAETPETAPEPQVTGEPAANETGEPVTTPTASPSAAPTEAPTEAPTAVPTEAPTAVPEKRGSVVASTSGISPLFPVLADDGFLPEGQGEFSLADEDAGVWLYASPSLRVEIHRVQQKSPKLMRWYEAEIFCKPEDDMFTTYAYDESRYTRSSVLTDPDAIARQHHLVFAMNSDFFIYRVARQKEVNYTYPIGIVTRRGNLMYDVPKKPTSSVYPPLDVCAIYPDGGVKLFLNGETTGKALAAEGARDVLSFGPILVQNGEISPRSSAFGDVDNPRTAFGMVEKGHYWCVLLEGRLASTYSQGGSCMWMAETMKRLGCTQAINLDGGQTACMIFMGQRINKIGTYSGSATNKDRPQNEVLGIGISDQVR